jgi:hypothetical protein
MGAFEKRECQMGQRRCPKAELGTALLAPAQHSRHLDHPVAQRQRLGKNFKVDFFSVRLQIETLQGGPAVSAEDAGDSMDIARHSGGQDHIPQPVEPQARPGCVLGAPAWHIGRADGDVDIRVLFQSFDQPQDVAGLVAQISVNRGHEFAARRREAGA